MATDVNVEMTVPSDTTYLCKVRQAVIDIVGTGMFSPVKANLIALAVDEAVANIMEHAYSQERGGDPNVRKDIQIIMKSDGRKFEVLIRDRGATFDPRVVADVDVREHVKQGRKGGLGIFLMRRIMDEINYTFKQGVHNELQMIKYVDDSAVKTKSSVDHDNRGK
jgi:anti-sigma regulatory factor (Ser/Thr protein kinase)